MDLLGALGRELFRPLATIVVPGATVAAPYAALLSRFHPQIARLWRAESALTFVVLLIVVVALGLILEDLGSRVEARVWDSILESKEKGHRDRWKKYLQLAFDESREPVGVKYVRAVLLRVKFELSLALALFIAIPGMIALGAAMDFTRLWSSACLGLVGAYLMFESYCGAKVLAEVRKWLLEQD